MEHKTTNIKDIVNVTAEIGDDHVSKYKKNGNSKDAIIALDAYKVCISATKTQLIYKKLTGHPTKIAFLNSNN